MNTHTEKSSTSKSEAVANALSQKKSIDKSTFQFTDNRPTALAQKKLQEAADNSPQAAQLKALQEMANNRNATKVKQASFGNAPVQLFKGAAGTNQAGAVVPFTLNQEFIDKHVAEDEEEAKTKTDTRINTPGDKGGASIKKGDIANTVATEENWTAVINANGDQVPEAFSGPDATERAAAAFNAGDYDDSGRFADSSSMDVVGWNVKYEDETLEAEEKTMKRRVAGDYDVIDLNVNLDINHCTQ